MAEAVPNFRSLPLKETVIGVQFDPLPNLTTAHLGEFWSSLGDNWPKVSDAPPLPPEHERFGSERMWERFGMISIGFTVNPATRIQIRNKTEDRMIQVQNGRFIYNWLGREGQPYARYQIIRGEFFDVFDRFRAYLEGKRIGKIEPNQWEVTYVNHVPAGTLWKSPSDWNRIFSSPVSLPASLPNSRLESFSAQWHYEIGEKRGRLHVELQHGKEGGDAASAKEVLVFKLTTRGPVDAKKQMDLQGGLDIGHDTITGSFQKLISQEAKDFWEEQ